MGFGGWGSSRGGVEGEWVVAQKQVIWVWCWCHVLGEGRTGNGGSAQGVSDLQRSSVVRSSCTRYVAIQTMLFRLFSILNAWLTLACDPVFVVSTTVVFRNRLVPRCVEYLRELVSLFVVVSASLLLLALISLLAFLCNLMTVFVSLLLTALSHLNVFI